MQDRRNFYRVLHLQPDAPFEMVRANFQTLMTKLAAHPDLGGEHWSAAHLNAAYATLRDPEKRAAYDRILLEKFDIETLSLGPATLKRPKRSRFKKRDPRINERNYYRILGIQFDAPDLIVESSYKTLRKAAGIDQGLVEEAFAIIGNAELRRSYDSLISTHGHLEAVARLSGQDEAKPAGATKARRATAPRPAAAYQPLIAHYCAFCKTPFSESVERQHDGDCLECSSPLFSPPESLSGLGRRVVSRIERDDPVELCMNWPEPAVPGRLVDLSPTGLRCITPWPLDIGECVKVDSARFLAVGEVAHRERIAEGTLAGLRFLTVRFREARGAFVSIKA
jgi:curved DNA-binding protein CbpA